MRYFFISIYFLLYIYTINIYNIWIIAKHCLFLMLIYTAEKPFYSYIDKYLDNDTIVMTQSRITTVFIHSPLVLGA